MSGICALVDLAGEQADTDLLARMLSAGAHRGPDGARTFIQGSAALGHLALYSAEPVGSPQPLCQSGICLSADVRLDNRDEVIGLLQGRGFHEAGPHFSDAELVLAAYRCWGEHCPGYLLGDFAFIVWDENLRRLFCARDPLGIKPLFYAQADSCLCVASEAQQILAYHGVPRTLDEGSLGRHLLGWPEAQDRTFFRSIHPVPPATWIAFAKEGQTTHTFWTFNREPDPTLQREQDAAANLLDVLRKAVSARIHSRGDVLGLALSGGLDSSSVATLASQALGASRSLVGLTYTFDRLTECDEREFVRTLAEGLAAETVFIDAESHWFLGDSEAFTPSLETPFLGWESSYRVMLRELTARGGKVLLTGHGADDLLGGSANIYADRFWSGDLGVLSEIVRSAPARSISPMRALVRYIVRPALPGPLERLLQRNPKGSMETPAWIDPAFSRRAGLLDFLAPSGWRRPGRLAEEEIQERALQLRSYLRAVHWHDRRASAVGIEPRHPFLDRRLFELVLTLPPRLLFQIGRTKPLLRQAMRGLLPERLRLRRDKTRFGRFLDLSLQDKTSAKIEVLFRSPLSADLGILDAKKLRASYQEYRTSQGTATNRLLWNAVTLELWLRRHYNWPPFEAQTIYKGSPSLSDAVFA